MACYHVFSNAIWRGLYSMIRQIMMQALCTVGLSCTLVCSQYFYFQPSILPLTFTKWESSLGMKAALGNIKYPTHERNRVTSSHRLNQTVSHRRIYQLSFAKYVAHFFMKSRAIFTAANSRFTLDSANSGSVSGF
jgi:hypothetical protein